MGSTKVVQLEEQSSGQTGHHGRYGPHRQLVNASPCTRTPRWPASSSRMAVSTRPNEEVTMNHEIPSTMTRNPITSPRNSNSPVSAFDPTTGRAISWIPKAPRVTLAPVEEHVERNDGEPEGHQHEDIVAEPVEHHADHQRHQPGQHNTHRQRGEERPAEGGDGLGPQLLVGSIGRQDGNGIGSRCRRTRCAPPRAAR